METKEKPEPEKEPVEVNNPVCHITLGDVSVVSNTHDCFQVAGLINQMLSNKEIREYLEIYKSKINGRSYLG